MRGVRKSESMRVAFALPPLVLAAVVWWPLLRCYFYADDFLDLQSIANDPWAAYLFRPVAGHVFLIRHAIFYVLHCITGPRPEGFFLGVFCTHLANVALVFAAIEALTASAHLACFGAALWGASPLNEGALGWYSNYGHVLAAAFVSWLVYRIACARRNIAPVPRREALTWCLALLLASLSVGVGIAAAVVLPVVVTLAIPPERVARNRRIFWVFPLVVVATYVAITSSFGPLAGETSGGVFVILKPAGDVRKVVAMLLHLLGFGTAGVLSGFWLPLAYPGPLAYAVAGLFAVVLAAGIVAASSATRRLLAALCILTLANYAIIAAGRASFYAAIGARAYGATETRYHYVGAMLLTMILCIGLAQLHFPAFGRTLLLVACFGSLAVAFVNTGWHIEQHDAERQRAAAFVETIRSEIDRSPPGAPAYIRNRIFVPAGIMSVPYFAGWAAAFTIFFPDDVVDRRPVFFVEPDPRVRQIARPGTRLARILVSGADATERPAADH